MTILLSNDDERHPAANL